MRYLLDKRKKIPWSKFNPSRDKKALFTNKRFLISKLTDNIIKHPISEQQQLAKNEEKEKRSSLKKLTVYLN